MSADPRFPIDDPRPEAMADPFATRASSTEPGGEAGPRTADPRALLPGDRFDDFDILGILGRGSFGVVYLARQVSLDRRVALKISPTRGQEGRVLARLQHPHIVTVHSQQARDGLRILCMQYVPSVPLDDLLRRLAARGSSWTGAELLAAIDRAETGTADFDPAQLEDRQMLASLDHVGGVCFLGSRLASALAHAHRQGVLHRDVKPANVLVSHYGRPLLLDFNMAAADMAADGEEAMFGGTLPYMAAEHLAAFDPGDATAAAAVTEAADQYSLAVLVFELATGRLPFPAPRRGDVSFAERLRTMAAERRRLDAIWTDPLWRDEPILTTVLRRALAVEPADRWPSCDALAAALEDAADLRRTLAVVRRENFLPGWCLRHPFIAVSLAGVLPNAIGSAVNIPYNLLRVIPAEDEPVFFRSVNVYNAVIYPLCVVLLIAAIRPLWLGWRGRSNEPEKRLRSRALLLPRWAVRISILGWLPAAFYFPWALHAHAIDLPWSRVAHFHVAILIAGLIALTYSALGVLCVVAFVFYPAFWTDPAGFRRRAAAEVRPVLKALKLVPFLAGSIPLVAVVLLITSSPQTFSDGDYEAFRILTTLLIGLGMAGFQLARAAMARARAALEAFAGTVDPDQRRPAAATD